MPGHLRWESDMSKASQEDAIEEEVDYGLSDHEKDTKDTNSTEGMDLDQPGAGKGPEARGSVNQRSSVPDLPFLLKPTKGLREMSQKTLLAMNA